MLKFILPVIAAFIFPFALFLLIAVFPLITLVLLARAAPPDRVPPLYLSNGPLAARSPPIL